MNEKSLKDLGKLGYRLTTWFTNLGLNSNRSRVPEVSRSAVEVVSRYDKPGAWFLLVFESDYNGDYNSRSWEVVGMGQQRI